MPRRLIGAMSSRTCECVVGPTLRGTGANWERVGRPGNCTAAWQSSLSLLVNESPLRMQPLSVKPLGLVVPDRPGPCDCLLSHNPLYSLHSVGRSFGSSWGTWGSWVSQPLVSMVSFPTENLSCMPFKTIPKRSRKGEERSYPEKPESLPTWR